MRSELHFVLDPYSGAVLEEAYPDAQVASLREVFTEAMVPAIPRGTTLVAWLEERLRLRTAAGAEVDTGVGEFTAFCTALGAWCRMAQRSEPTLPAPNSAVF